jgi:predicted peptidase
VFSAEAFVPPILVHSLPFLLLGLASQRSSRGAGPETGFLHRSISLHGRNYKYQVFVPSNWSPELPWPIVLFLHGAGERGSDGNLQAQFGLPTAIRNGPPGFPAVVVMPQCPLRRWWAELEMQELAMATLLASRQEFHGDPKRTFLTGLSMGGYGCWSLAANHPGFFAAIVPICGGVVLPERLRGDFPDLAATKPLHDPEIYARFAEKIGRVPIWIFHGEKDEIVPVEESRKMYAAIKAARGYVRYTEFPGVGHESWDLVYTDPGLLIWMLTRSLRK